MVCETCEEVDYPPEDKPWRALREQSVIARKDHECVFCHGRIKRGQRHYLSVGIYDGIFTQTRSCTDFWECSR